MSTEPYKLNPVVPRPGVPLYRDVQTAMIDAIRAGIFRPGDRIPNTKQLSKDLSVSLVTAHRAMQELVVNGYLERTQGRGTFVRDRPINPEPRLTIGVVMNPSASMADFYHSQLLEGMCQACRVQEMELLILHPRERAQRGCQGFLCVNNSEDDLKHMYDVAGDTAPVISVGERSHLPRVRSVDINNVDLAEQAVKHLLDLGHRRIGYVGSNNQRTHSRERRQGFLMALKEAGVSEQEVAIIAVDDWRMTENEKMNLSRLLNRGDRPTAVVAGGYYLALDVYAAATRQGLVLPSDLSVIGVDDPPSAAHLFPSLTTMQQPLVHLGQAAVTVLEDSIRNETMPDRDLILRAELMVRHSTTSAPE